MVAMVIVVVVLVVKTFKTSNPLVNGANEPYIEGNNTTTPPHSLYNSQKHWLAGWLLWHNKAAYLLHTGTNANVDSENLTNSHYKPKRDFL